MAKQPNWHVLVLTDFFFPDSSGGANKMAFHTSKGIAELGHRVSIITRRVNPDLPSHENLNGLEVYRYDLPQKNFISFIISSRRQIWKFLDDVRKKNSTPLDLLIIHQPLMASSVDAHPLINGVPWIYNFHSPWGEEFLITRNISPQKLSWRRPAVTLQKKIRDRIEVKVLNQCQRIIVLSHFMQMQVERLHGFTQKTVIVPGGVDTNVFCPSVNSLSLRKNLGLPSDKVVIFTLRNLRQRMGLTNLIGAMARLGEAKEEVHLVIAGKGELEGELKTLASQLNLADRVSFPGYVMEEDLPKYYQAADLFVLPTEHLEGFGMVTLEALASGLPVIGTPIGATPEILGQVGKEWLSKDSSSEALAEKISERTRWLIDNPTDYQSLRHSCRDLAIEKYAWPGIIRRWETICQQATRLGSPEAL